jgi:hypothetical protein
VAQAAFVVAVGIPIGWQLFVKSRPPSVESAESIAGFYTAGEPCGSTLESHEWIAVDITGTYFHVLRADRRSARYAVRAYDSAAKCLTVYDRAHDATYVLTADLQEGQLRITGGTEGEAVDARLSRADPQRFALRQGVQW